jgi:signal peptidase I
MAANLRFGAIARRRAAITLALMLIVGTGLVALTTYDLLRVSSNSMEPTLSDSNLLIVDRVDGLIHKIWDGETHSLRGAIVVFRAPFDRNTLYVKRIVAVGGDRVRIYRGRLIINKVVVNEPYLTPATDESDSAAYWPMDEIAAGQRDIVVPSENYFVLGDNRRFSVDSRNFGSIPKRLVIGTVTTVIRGWRFSRMQSRLIGDNAPLARSAAANRRFVRSLRLSQPNLSAEHEEACYTVNSKTSDAQCPRLIQS